jgi:lactobin A/cerein 7B family class IIb bacteriocin
MTDLNENELERVVGGTEPVTAAIAVSIGVAAAGAFLTGLYFGLK